MRGVVARGRGIRQTFLARCEEFTRCRARGSAPVYRARKSAIIAFMRILALTLGLLMVAATGFAQDTQDAHVAKDGSGSRWSRAGCLGRCGAELERCTQQRFGKMAAKD